MNARQEGTERPGAAATPYARVVIVKPGLDEHHHSTHGIAQALRDEGFEVTCTEPEQASEQIVAVVIVEDPSMPSGSHLTMVDTVIERIKQQAACAVPVLIGGILPAVDFTALKNAGTNLMLEWAC